MPVKGWNRSIDLTPETRPQDDKKLSERHGWRPNKHIIGRFGIQYDEMDEVKTTRIFMSYFSLVFTDLYFSHCKYPTLLFE